MAAKRTAIYIDGFNLYYGSLKNHDCYKWLNIEALCETLVADRPIVSIKYFTARIIAKAARRRNANIRQDAYIKAVETISHSRVKVYRGTYRRDPKELSLCRPIPCKNLESGSDHCHPGDKIRVWKNEEKQTDVSLAVHLVNDAWLNLYDQAIVISNDTDLIEAINIAKEDHEPTKLSKTIGLITPTTWGRKPAGSLTNIVDWHKEIKESHLRQSQLPNTINTATGSLYRPPEWT